MQFPIRKKRPIEIHTKYGSMKLLVVQASLYESIIFRKLLDQDRLQERWLDFIDTNATYNIKSPFHLIPRIKNRIKRIVLGTQPDLIQQVYELWDKAYESVYSGVDMGGEGRKSLEGSDIVDVCGSDLSSAIMIQEKCTREQYEWMLDRVIFKDLEKSEEGKKINDMMISNTIGGLTQEQIEIGELVKKNRAEGAFEDIEGATFILEGS